VNVFALLFLFFQMLQQGTRKVHILNQFVNTHPRNEKVDGLEQRENHTALVLMFLKQCEENYNVGYGK
jgi:hypothetical protein